MRVLSTEEQATCPSTDGSSAVDKALPPSKQVWGRGTQRRSKGSKEASPMLVERIGFDKYTPLMLIPSSLLKDCLSSYTTGMQPPKLSPVGLGGGK